MSLTDWLANRWIVAHEPSVEEIADLFAVIDRDLEDAAVPRLSEDWRLGIAYNAALQLATPALAADDIGRLANARMSVLFCRSGSRSALTRKRLT